MKPFPFTIGITGAIGSGKNTAGDFISLVLGLPQYSFAAPLKEAITHLFGVSPETLDSHEGKANLNEFWGISPRNMMREVSESCIKPKYGQDFWIRRAEQIISSSDTCSKGVIVTDVRFENEAEFIREHGILIHISRQNNPHSNQMSSHVSDNGVILRLDKGDGQVLNDSDLSCLYDRIFWLLRQDSRCVALLNEQNFMGW